MTLRGGRVVLVGGALAAIACVSVVATARAQAPDRIVVGASIWTGVSGAPRANALAIRGDRIVAVGADSAIRALAGASTTVLDLRGRLVVPGFEDAHWHFHAREEATLDDAGNARELEKRLRAFAADHRTGWIVGRGWAFGDFPNNTPTRRWLDAIFPDRPAVIGDRDGHTALANTKALALAGITRETKDPPAGTIDRDLEGEATGVLRETARGAVMRLLPPVSADEAYDALLRVLARAASLGLTSIQVASMDDATSVEHQAYRRAAREGTLPVRLRVALPLVGNPTAAQMRRVIALRDSFPGPMLRFGILKGMLDGTVDAKTAAMLEPYVGGGTGLPRWSQDSLDRAVARWDSAGVQLELHAIGDRAVRMALDAYERAATRNHTTGRRHRIEHIEVPSLADVPRFKALGVIASTQAIFATPDQTTLVNYAPLLGPARASHSNAFRIFDDAGAMQAFGSDFPVFTMDPLQGMWAAVTRTTWAATPKGGWYPQHRISIDAALRHYTAGSAYVAFAERDRGTIEAGKLADFVALSEDIVREPNAMRRAKVLLTVMGGRETYRSSALAR